MEHIGGWFAKQFDNGLTPTGAVIALCLVSAGIISAVAAANGNFWISIPLLCIFISVLGALFVAAIKTDPELKMSRQEKTERWKKLPFYFKASLLILCFGPLLSEISSWLIPENPKSFPFTALSASVSSIVFAKGMQKHRPPLPVRGAKALTFESAPEQYLKKLRSTVWATYIAGLMMAVVSALYFVR
jgi:amino acid transporter